MTERTRCEYCGECPDDELGCNALSPGFALDNGDRVKTFCSRRQRHDGDHVACGSFDHEIERWPNDG